MTRADLLHILSALDASEAEFEQLMLSEEWYVTEVVDQIQSAKQIILGELNPDD